MKKLFFSISSFILLAPNALVASEALPYNNTTDLQYDNNLASKNENNTALINLLMRSTAYANYEIYEENSHNPYIIRAENARSSLKPDIEQYTETYISTHYAGTSHYEERNRVRITWPYGHFFGQPHAQANSVVSHIIPDIFGGYWVLGRSFILEGELNDIGDTADETYHKLHISKFNADLSEHKQAGAADLIKWHKDGQTNLFGQVVFAGQKDVSYDYGLIHPDFNGQLYTITRWGQPKSKNRQYTVQVYENNATDFKAEEINIRGEIFHSDVLPDGTLQIISHEVEQVGDVLTYETKDISTHIHMYHVKTRDKINVIHKESMSPKSSSLVGADFEYLGGRLYLAFKDYSVNHHHGKPDFVITTIVLDAKNQKITSDMKATNWHFFVKDAYLADQFRLNGYMDNIRTLDKEGQFIIMTGSGTDPESQQHRHFVDTLDGQGAYKRHWLPSGNSIDRTHFDGNNYFIGGNDHNTKAFWQYQGFGGFVHRIFDVK